MNTEKFKAKDIKMLFYKQTIASMEDFMNVIGTSSPATIFRKLKELDYITSYSHKGSYYSLKELSKFNNLGLWNYEFVHFSRFGSLKNTIKSLVLDSESGYYSHELNQILNVGVKETLLRLHQEKQISRKKFVKNYLYCSLLPVRQRQQIKSRQLVESKPSEGKLPKGETKDELKAAIIFFYCLLDEKQRRLYAGLESLKWGFGGDQKVAELLCIDTGTVAKGRKELESHDIEFDRVRKIGGGRYNIEKKLRKFSEKSKS